jgi:hypothetical protein
VNYSIPYSDYFDYKNNHQNNTNNTEYKKLITTYQYDNLIVSLNNSNNKSKLKDCNGLFYFYQLCDSWNKYHEFKPIDKLSILKKGLYSFKCYNGSVEISGNVNIMTYDENCKLLNNNSLVSTSNYIDLNNFSVDYSSYESWMDKSDKTKLIE